MMGRTKTKKKSQNRTTQSSNLDIEPTEANENFEEGMNEEEGQNSRSSADFEEYLTQNNNMTNIIQGDGNSTFTLSDNSCSSPTGSSSTPEESNCNSAMDDTASAASSSATSSATYKETTPEPSTSASFTVDLPKVMPVQLNKVGPDDCKHMVKAVSMAGIRKAFKGDIKPICGSRPCASRSDELLKSSSLWFCLQCGSIGCGDQNAQNGDAMGHFKVPRSDLHCIVVVLGENYKCWCFLCQSEVNSTNAFTKEAVAFVKRTSKTRLGFSKLGQSSNQPVSSVPIALGPPPPPPPTNPPKPFQKVNKQQTNKNSKISYSSTPNNSEWPLGLENLGNTCFMNSALQCLSRTRMLIPQLELYGSGNVIEIMVSTEEPAVTILKTKEGVKSEVRSFDGDRTISLDRTFELSLDIDKEMENTLEIEDKSSSSPASELDSVLEGAESNSSKDEKEELNAKLAKEIELEMKTPLKLNLEIPKESMTGRLKHAFKAITRHSDVVPGCEPYSNREFLHKNNDGPYGFRPNDIHSSLSKQFRPMQQHDSHELLRTVVDMMKKDQIKAFRLAIMDRYGVKKSEIKNLDSKLAELLKQWDRKLYHKTFVDEIFGGELVTTQTCLQCNSVRRSHEDFLDLSLPIRVARANPNHSSKKSYSLFDDDHDIVINRTLESCLRAFTEPELLTGDNNVECENCHRANLDKLTAGASLEEVFPSAKQHSNSNEKSGESSFQTKGKTEGKQRRQEDRKKKRQPRQAKLRARMNQEIPDEKSAAEISKSPGASLTIVEDHFTTERTGKSIDRLKSGSEDDAKSSKSGSLDDYVVISSPLTRLGQSSPGEEIQPQGCNSINYKMGAGPPYPNLWPTQSAEAEGKNQAGKRKYTEMDQDVDGDEEEEEYALPTLVQVGPKSRVDGEEEEEDYDLPALVQVGPKARGVNEEGVLMEGVSSSQDCKDVLCSNLSMGLSESLQNLSLIPNDEMDVNGDMDNDNESIERIPSNDNDFDLDDDELEDMQAVDGAIDASDAEEDNGVPPLDLGFIEDTDNKRTEDMISVIASGNCDEGYSEGDNSSEEKNSRSASASSSRNSACESENMDRKPEKVEEKKKAIPVTKCPCSRQQMISRPPEFLTVHLKRFQMTTRFHTSKVSNHVEFPFILDLTSFCSEAPEDCKKPGYKGIYDEDGEVMYSLYGIVEHSGSLHWGHYVAYVKVAANNEKNSGDSAAAAAAAGKSQDKWFYISDSHVTPTTPSSINSRDAYILFYERIRGEEKSSRISQNYMPDSRPGPSSYETSWEPTSSSYTIPLSTPVVSTGWTDNENWEADSSSTTPADTSTEYSHTATSTFTHEKIFGEGDESSEGGVGACNTGFPSSSSLSSTQYGSRGVPQVNTYSNWTCGGDSNSTYAGYGSVSASVYGSVPLVTTTTVEEPTSTTADDGDDDDDGDGCRSTESAHAYSQLEDID